MDFASWEVWHRRMVHEGRDLSAKALFDNIHLPNSHCAPDGSSVVVNLAGVEWAQLVRDAFLERGDAASEDHWCMVEVYDATPEVNIDGMMVVMRGLVAKLTRGTGGLPTTTTWPLGWSQTPKANSNSIKNLIEVTNKWYLDEGIDLDNWVGYSHWDDTSAGKKAHEEVLRSSFCRCARHQQTACKRAPAEASLKVLIFLAGIVQFSAPLLPRSAFSLLWNQAQAKVIEEGDVETAMSCSRPRVKMERPERSVGCRVAVRLVAYNEGVTE